MGIIVVSSTGLFRVCLNSRQQCLNHKASSFTALQEHILSALSSHDFSLEMKFLKCSSVGFIFGYSAVALA